MILKGKPQLPGDKSISHRAAIFAAMAEGVTKIDNFSASADCASTLECLKRLGVGIERDGSQVSVTGVGKTGFSKAGQDLDCGNSGTTMRLLSGVLAGQQFSSVLTGDESLRSRPMKRVKIPLEIMGAKVETADGNAPLKITGRHKLTAVEYKPPVASAQIKSCVLLAGLNADGITKVIEPIPTRDHTERMLAFLGASLEKNGDVISISGESRLTAKDITIPCDVSAAAFFITATACLSGSEVVMENVGLNPSRISFIDVAKELGVDIEISDNNDLSGEPTGTITVRGGNSKAVQKPYRIGGGTIANLIDEIPILAILGTQLDGGIEVRDAGELRAKESDRIAAVVNNLKKMNAEIEEFPDGFRVGRSSLKGAEIDSYGDHRIAMAFGIASLFAEGETKILDKKCADVSFPGFFEELKRISQ